MADAISKTTRSQVMAAVRSNGNKATEIKFISLLRKNRITGWHRNSRLFGKPDFVFHHERLAVFVDGCFWHGCPRHLRRPKSNQKYWSEKIARNEKRDRLVTRKLRQLGWHVVRIWSHELPDETGVTRRLRRILSEQGCQSKRIQSK
jgi:DNA mismatch endonuclease (patch repair protein)